MAETPTTELEAVNEMLAAIGEAPVNSIAGTLTAEVTIAVSTLRNTSRKVQLTGYWFNEEDDYELSRDVNNIVAVPGNALNIDLTNEISNVDLVERDGKLYDKVAHSFTIDFNPKCTITFFLPYEDLPEAAREYIKIKAARIYQDRVVGSGDHHTFTQQDESEAYATLLNLESQNGDYTIFDNYDTYSIIARRRPITKAF